MKRIITAAALIGGMTLGANSHAWECPQHIAAAEKALAAAAQALETAQGSPNSALAHTLRDDAEMLLHSAKHNHENPAAGAFDHARSMAKAKSAKAFAETAEELANR
ncbi:hypothetical protein [Motiliproteus sp. SC1-56]|uniref:hypothetical protein n=1 Tax=Motiliproteus sp. SC1-56 TaxID=2799565 RepID=UPI001A8DADA1|nr:hypothetical protein [Motiliproteus sp. SC1-56]